MEDLAHLEKLKLEQSKALEENEATQASRQKIRDDYLKLKQKLTTLADTVTQRTMIPIGDVGFFPGKLVHTNEIMVLLGDNWFAERSSKQASEIVDRRVKMVDSQLEGLKKEYDNIASHRQFTDQFQNINQEHGNIQEIKETLPNTESYQKGKSRVAHKPKHNLTQRNVKFKTSDELVENLSTDLHQNVDATINHDELLARLNELEKEEQEEEERAHNERMNEILQGEYKKPSNHIENQSSQLIENIDDDKNVTGSTRLRNGSSIDDNLDDNSKRHVQFESDLHSENVNECEDDGNIIKFLHTCQQRGRSSSESDITLKQKVNSPADIFEQFSSNQDIDGRPLKSILKKDSRSNSNENLKLKPILKTSPDHRPGTPEYIIDDPKPILKTPPDTQGSERRPGTPEYTLSDEPRPILKGHVDNLEHNKNKIQEVHFAENTSYIEDYGYEETRSILKSAGGESTLTLDDEQRSILKHDLRKTILKSPETTRVNKVIETTQDQDPRSILKHNGPEAFSGQIIERDLTSSAASQIQMEVQPNKPVSRFKVSRKKK